ncbi:RNA methyltransferase [[Clostridium] innocuum]|uniref:RNA methyltransferase n=1 Tax=Clostridium TaxID=1485 RepID=UPI000D7ADC93|nr:RNA methyltransferase [[Clostridium] innocuum]PWJ14327.1 23S rRNA (uracil1939-C5)-methyltransferase [[Clostridium] innocuum]SSA45691.1 23S rRNA (uracil1939-C5)-methyltransferase [[Clostridium] innocuum]
MESNSVGTFWIVKTVDMFPRTNGNWLKDWRNLKYADINQGQSSHVETVVLLSKLKTKKHVDIELQADELDLTSSECKITYNNIKQYVFDKYGFKVSNLYIAQVKEKCGIRERENYNKSKNNASRQPSCPIEKEEAIKDAFKYFKMI